MKVFVTGATGFLGSYILRALREVGNIKIIALRRPTSPTELVQDIQQDVKWVTSDLQDPHELDRDLKEVDAIIHAAAMVSMHPADRKNIYKINVTGTANLINLALNKGITKFIHVSSVAALGPVKSGEVLDEKPIWNGTPPFSTYGHSKYLAELEVWRGNAEGLEGVVMNPSYIFGGGFWSEGPTALVRKIYDGLSYYPSGVNGIVDVRDVADMAVLLLENADFTGRRMICSAENISHKELFEKIAQSLQVKSPGTKLSAVHKSLALLASKLRLMPAAERKLISRESFRISSMDLQYDHGASVNELKFQYRPLNQTIEDTCACFLETYPRGKNMGILPM